MAEKEYILLAGMAEMQLEDVLWLEMAAGGLVKDHRL